jgi:hypothetical protein
VNIAVLFAVLEADLGRRKISAFRILRPLFLAAGIIPLFITIRPPPEHQPPFREDLRSQPRRGEAAIRRRLRDSAPVSKAKTGQLSLCGTVGGRT